MQSAAPVKGGRNFPCVGSFRLRRSSVAERNRSSFPARIALPRHLCHPCLHLARYPCKGCSRSGYHGGERTLPRCPGEGGPMAAGDHGWIVRHRHGSQRHGRFRSRPLGLMSFRRTVTLAIVVVGAATLGGCTLADFPVIAAGGPVTAIERDIMLRAFAIMMIVVVPVFALTALVLVALPRLQQAFALPARVDVEDGRRRGLDCSGAHRVVARRSRVDLHAQPRSLQAARPGRRAARGSGGGGGLEVAVHLS